MTYSTLVALAVASIALAQPKARYLDKKTFFQMETVAAPAISPHGSQIVFTRRLDGYHQGPGAGQFVAGGRGRLAAAEGKWMAFNITIPDETPILVGHTGRFRAAVSMRPVIDWGSFMQYGWAELVRSVHEVSIGRSCAVRCPIAIALRSQR